MAERYPTVRAGQKVTGILLDSMLTKTVRKTSDTARATDTLSDDPELQFAVEANATYVFEGVLLAGGSAADDNINLDWSAPSGSDGTWTGIGPVLATNGDPPVLSADTVRLLGTGATSARTFGVALTTASTSHVITVNGLLIIGSTAGTHALSWARSGIDNGTITLFADSWLKYTRIA